MRLNVNSEIALQIIIKVCCNNQVRYALALHKRLSTGHLRSSQYRCFIIFFESRNDTIY
jgi:hypothetical protein